MTRKRKTFNLSELQAIDPVLGADSVLLEKLLLTACSAIEGARMVNNTLNDAIVSMQCSWIERHRGDPTRAWEWIDSFLDADWEWTNAEWSNNAQHYHLANSHLSAGRQCGICGVPAGHWSGDLHACSDRHMKALRGELGNEQ